MITARWTKGDMLEELDENMIIRQQIEKLKQLQIN